MPGCFVPFCTHHSELQNNSCFFVRFPRTTATKRQWIDLIRRSDKEPNGSSHICSCHFVDNDANNLPTLFPYNNWGKKSFQFTSPEKKKRKRVVRASKENETSPPENSLPVRLFSDDDHNDSLQSNEYGSGTEISLGQLQSLGTQTEPNSQSVSTDTNDDNIGFQKSAATQTVHIFRPEFYEAELYFKDKIIDELKEEIRRLTIQPFGYFFIEQKNELCIHYTGLTLSAFNIIKELSSLVPLAYYKNKPVKRLKFEDQFLMTLMKLRHNFTYLDLGVRFGVAKSTAFNVVYSFLPAIHAVVFQSILEDNLPSLQKNKRSLPAVFQKYANCRIVLDCTEMRCEVPSGMTEQKLTYSSYKHYNTVKVLLGVAPNGSVTYCSDAYPGSTSDKKIVEHCGVVRFLTTGDMVLADKGFLIGDILPFGVTVNMPPFLQTPQFSEQEVMETRNVARARVHIERANERMKKYRILTAIPSSLFPRISMVIQCCAALVNFQNPLLQCMASDFNPETANEDIDDIEIDDVELD